MTFLNSSSDGLLVDTMMETILLHMMILLDDSMLPLDDDLRSIVEDGKDAALLLVDEPDAIHDVGLDPNTRHMMAQEAILLLLNIHDDPTLLMMYPQGILDEAVQRCCRQSDVEVHDDDPSVLTQYPLGCQTLMSLSWDGSNSSCVMLLIISD